MTAKLDSSDEDIGMLQKAIRIYLHIYIYIYLGSKRSFMHVLLKRMAHSLFIIFLRVFSYFLISFILLWSFCKISIIVLKDATVSIRLNHLQA